VAVAFPSLDGFDATIQLPRNDRHDVISSYMGVAGRLGLTLNSTGALYGTFGMPNRQPDTKTQLTTQYADGCVVPCGPPNDGKECHANRGYCVVLTIGSATVAATPAVNASQRIDMNQIEQALAKIMQYAVAYRHEPPPWCQQDLERSLVKRVSINYFSVDNQRGPGEYISVLWSKVHNTTLPQRLPGADSAAQSGKLEEWFQNSLVRNCTLWDTLGVGFVGQRDSMADTGGHTFADAMVTMWWPLVDGSPGSIGEQRAVRLDTCNQPFPRYNREYGLRRRGLFAPGERPAEPTGDFQNLPTTALEQAVAQVVRDAAIMVDQQAAQELATTDSTKTVVGALWDTSVVVLALVSLACGRAETEQWIVRRVLWVIRVCRLGKLPFVGQYLQVSRPSKGVLWAAKACYCLFIVLLALVMAPLIILLSEIAIQDQNAKGDTSKLGWVPADVPALDASKPGCVVVGVVAVRVTAEPEPIAFELLCFNLALAVAGSLFIVVASWCRFYTDYLECLAAAQAAQQAAPALALPSTQPVAAPNVPMQWQQCIQALLRKAQPVYNACAAWSARLLSSC
jgi:hypothetical protein